MNNRILVISLVDVAAAIAVIALVFFGNDLGRWVQTGLLAVGLLVIGGSIGAGLTLFQRRDV